MSLLQYQPRNLKVHMPAGTDCRSRFLPIGFVKRMPWSIWVFPAICNGIKTSQPKRIIKKKKNKTQSSQNREYLVSKYTYTKKSNAAKFRVNSSQILWFVSNSHYVWYKHHKNILNKHGISCIRPGGKFSEENMNASKSYSRTQIIRSNDSETL